MKKLAFTRFKPLDYACTEALNTLCTNLTFVGSNIKKIMITSCQAAEGKSFITMNILRTMASLGKRVVLVDADLRRSMLSSRYGVRTSDEKEQGLAHYLAGMCSLEDVLYATNIDGAYMLPVGCSVTNSLSLLSTMRMHAMLDQLAETFDIVLVDAPPVGIIIDAAEIAKSCDGTLMIVSYNKASRRELSDAKRQIERTGCRVLGAVLNNVELSTYSNKRYYNKTYYTHYNANAMKVARKKTQRPPAEQADGSPQ